MLSQSSRRNLLIGYELFVRDMFVLRQKFISKFINTITWPIVSSIVFGYILPAISNLPLDYGSFVLVGAVVQICFITALSDATNFYVDISQNKLIDYERALPISFDALILQKTLSTTVRSLVYTIPLFPIGKMLLWYRFDLSQACWWKLLLIFAIINLFFSFVAIWAVTIVKSLDDFQNLWMRMYVPLIWLGSYMNTWQQSYEYFPALAYITLLNPVTYSNEGMRAALFGQAGFLPFWLSLGVLSLQTVLIGWWSIRRFKRQLDAV